MLHDHIRILQEKEISIRKKINRKRQVICRTPKYTTKKESLQDEAYFVFNRPQTFENEYFLSATQIKSSVISKSQQTIAASKNNSICDKI